MSAFLKDVLIMLLLMFGYVVSVVLAAWAISGGFGIKERPTWIRCVAGIASLVG
jgi:hypothetical protein